MKICMVGEGAFGKKHLTGLRNIDDVEVVSLVGGVAGTTETIANEFDIPHWSLDLQEGLSHPGVDDFKVTAVFLKKPFFILEEVFKFPISKLSPCTAV